MKLRSIQALLILVLGVPAAAFFIIFPQWEIEHPGNASLILRGERHWLWQAPAHSHVDFMGIAVPVIAVVVVVVTLLVVAVNRE